MDSWKCIEDLFYNLHNTECQYIILRNYEEIDADNFYTSGHADIDFLVEDYKKFSKAVKAYPRFIEDDGIHYKVNINDVEVIFDVRTVGDGYYDKRWGKDLLKNRRLLEGRFFIPDKTNYYYSLAYHAILQKKELSNDYLSRLNQMASDLGVKASTEREHLNLLQEFMKNNGYCYTIPYDVWVPLRKEILDSTMVKKQINVYVRDFKIKLLQVGSDVKHRLLRK